MAADNRLIKFKFKNKKYSIFITRVEVYPQALSAVTLIYSQIKKYPKVTVIDVGGFTADYLQILNGHPNLEASDSLENGVITLYNHLIKVVNSEFDLLLAEEDIDAVITDNESELPSEVKSLIHKQCDILSQIL